MVAISSDIIYRSPLWDNIHRHPISTLQQFLDRADKYMKLDDAIEKGKNGLNKPSGSGDTPKDGGNDQGGSKKRGNNGPDHRNEKKAKSGSNDKPTKYEPRFTNYTTLSATRAEIYLASHQEVPYRRPPPIKKEMSKRDKNKFCRFHGDYGHDTNECNHLKDEIEFLLRSGKLKKYKAEKTQGEGSSNNPGFKRQRSPPLQPEPVDFTLDTICGGPHLAGDSNKARERYARTLRHELEAASTSEVMTVEERPSKKPRYESESLTFTEEDAKHVRYPHNDPLVMTVQIANRR